MSQRKILLGVVVIAAVAFLLVFKRPFPPPFKLVPEKSFDVASLMRDLDATLKRENWLAISDYSLVTLAPHNEERERLLWLDEKDKTRIIHGYVLAYDAMGLPPDDPPSGEAVIATVRKIAEYLKRHKFQPNEKNTYFFGKETGFWNPRDSVTGTLGFDKDNIKCTVEKDSVLVKLPGDETGKPFTGFRVECGDITTSILVTEPGMEIVRVREDEDLGLNVRVTRIVGDYAIGSSGASGGGAWSIWKEENGKWELLQTTQAGWSCSLLLDNKVPSSLFKKPEEEECIFYECWECEGDECGEYKDECERQAAGEELIYQELYEEKYGKER